MWLSHFMCYKCKLTHCTFWDVYICLLTETKCEDPFNIPICFFRYFADECQYGVIKKSQETVSGLPWLCTVYHLSRTSPGTIAKIDRAGVPFTVICCSKTRWFRFALSSPWYFKTPSFLKIHCIMQGAGMLILIEKLLNKNVEQN